MKKCKNGLFLILFTTIISESIAQRTYWGRIENREPTLGIAAVYQKFNTPQFQLKLVKSSQTVAALNPKSDPYFDFTPGERLEIRDKDSLYHLGDINLRIKDARGNWIDYSTAYHRAPVKALETTGNILAAADLSNTLPKDIPVNIKRYYQVEDSLLVVRFEISNKQNIPVEIGAMGVPMIFNNILEGKSLNETHKQNVFFDPYIGKDAGYLEVKRLSGRGPVLLVLPEENFSFEAYRPLLDDLTPKSIVFEGFHEWMVHSKAYSEKEWKGVEQWNKPTSIVIEPGDTINCSFKLVLSDGVKHIQDTLLEEAHPVAMGVPGYVIPQDVHAKLFIKYNSEITSVKVEPNGALDVDEEGKTASGYKIFKVAGKKWGRARITITYGNGLQQTINYKVIKPEEEVIHDFGKFLTSKQWFDNDDIFGRNPSVISYDYENNEQLTEDGRVWISGLSDEGGAGSWLAAVMKQLVQPDKDEILKLQKFIDQTLWGNIQYSEGPHKYGVKKSVYYYEPDSMPEGTYNDKINYNTWAAWSHKHANKTERSYNYPHVAAAYWVMYRLSRYYTNLVDNRPWQWYLEQAYHTSVAMVEQAPHYAQFGQMEGSVFLLILKDLQNENYTEMAVDLERRMKARADHWRALNYPFGSEMPWDSTGQEEVYMWSDYFGYDYKAMITLNAILAYMPTMPHWAYNGNARRYWDFLYGGKAGKTSRIERQIHHYGSSLNAIPVLSQYRKTPEDFYLLKVGYGGLLGGISNITREGFGPAAFHSFPSTLAIDGISGDYGSGFYGYAVNSATYLVHNEILGWLVFGGNMDKKGDTIAVDLTTAAKSRIFLAPENLWLTLDAGTFKKISYNTQNGEVSLTLNGKTEYAPIAYLRVDGPLKLPYKKIRGAYEIKLKQDTTIIKF